ncbi:uncharacterized protein LOC126983432 [Eriocheir sinensis]|uniref:uncharacterized protein LOC126983432 n=1 Tax=Eriocheir sinensis TaxID=95602 RepID=UPI0021CAB9AE|nr:uncharacterized protein LOC126983432 [Eriocheir sinensis]
MELATPTPAPPPQEADPDSTNYKVWASLQGRPLDLKFAENMSAWGELGGDVRLCLGAEGPDNASFTGMITGVTLLTKEEVEEQEQEQKKEEKGEKKEKEEGIRTTGNCSVLLARNILTHPLDVSWTTKGPVLTLEWELPLDPCLTPPKTVWLQGSRAYQGSLRLCRSLGGHFPTEEEATGDLLKAHNCSTGDVLTWASGWEESEDDPTALCPVLLAEGGMDKWACYSKLDCTLCLVPEGLTYTLFGARRDFDRHYTLRTLADGTFEFQGQDTSTISQGELGWRLSSSLHNDELIQGSWVMGRQRWHPSGSLQQPTTTLPYKATEKTINTSTDILTFTVCNAIQFSSDDGVCLLRSERCDGRTDSPDGSDEEHCGSRRAISKDTNYDTRVSPFLGRKQKGILLYEIHVMFINKMSTEKGMASVEMNLYLDWEDSRIEFVDTKMGRNSLACDDIWTPTLNVFAGYTRGPVVQPRSNRSDCYIYWDQKPREEQQLGDPLMSRSFTKMNITQYQNLVMEFPCLLRVSKYPFGKYMCNLTFGIFRDHQYIKWKSMRPLEEDYNDLKYYGDRDLLDFRLEKVTAQVHHDGKLTFTLHLVGQPDYHLTNSFLPSALMFVICYSSLFFPISGFNERIMVSLTSLLVLVALFSQATNTYVRTPYYKLIDVWYVGLIFLCFAVVIANVLVNYLRVLRVKSQNDLMKKVLAARKCNIACQIFLLTLFMSLIFVFVLFNYNNL